MDRNFFFFVSEFDFNELSSLLLIGTKSKIIRSLEICKSIVCSPLTSQLHSTDSPCRTVCDENLFLKYAGTMKNKIKLHEHDSFTTMNDLPCTFNLITLLKPEPTPLFA